MKIRHILDKKGRQFQSIAPDKLLSDAVSIMMKHRIGSLVVMEGSRLVSIITERDVMYAVAQHPGAALAQVKVRDLMPRALITCTDEDSVDHAMDLMTGNPKKQRIRHLPVVDGDRLVGIISIGDIVHALLTETQFENKLLKNYIKHWPEEGAAT